MSDSAQRHAPSTLRNRAPLLARLSVHLPSSGEVLEVASGSGEHIAYFASAMPGVTWQPSDPDPAARASIDSHAAALGNVRPALPLDTTATWPALTADAVLCINMIHISPFSATVGLCAGSAAVLRPGGMLILYGPFYEDGVATEGNRAFDAELRSTNPAWGVRDLTEVTAVAVASGFAAPLVERLPANNLLVIFRR